MAIWNPVSASAYERKAELGGGYRSVLLDRRTDTKTESEILPTIEAARFWARQQINQLMNGQPWRPGYQYKPYWVLNVWIQH